jgi:hypothetical protein|tara:strand:+ start:3482 stop:4255 length:774 start_codon:yes stop_codon:yes gene_type:complete
MSCNDDEMNMEIDASLLRTKLEIIQYKRIENSWTKSNCDFMRITGDKILNERDLHLEASKIWSEYGERYTMIPVLLLNIATGIVNFSMSETIPVHWNYYIGSLNLAAAMLTSLSHYYKPIEQSEKHLHIARRFGRLHRSLLLELELPKKERQLYSDCIRLFKNEYDNIKTECPILPDKAYERLYNREKKLKNLTIFRSYKPHQQQRTQNPFVKENNYDIGEEVEKGSEIISDSDIVEEQQNHHDVTIITYALDENQK